MENVGKPAFRGLSDPVSEHPVLKVAEDMQMMRRQQCQCAESRLVTIRTHLESHSSLSLAEKPLYEDNILGDRNLESRMVPTVQATPAIPAQEETSLNMPTVSCVLLAS